MQIRANRRPAKLFKKINILSLATYVQITLKYYNSLGMGGNGFPPNPAGKLKLGRCKNQVNTVPPHAKFTLCGSGVQGINWTNKALMGPICKWLTP